MAKKIYDSQPSEKAYMRKSDIKRLPEVQLILAKERNEIFTKIKAITVMMDEFFERRKNKE